MLEITMNESANMFVECLNSSRQYTNESIKELLSWYMKNFDVTTDNAIIYTELIRNGMIQHIKDEDGDADDLLYIIDLLTQIINDSKKQADSQFLHTYKATNGEVIRVWEDEMESLEKYDDDADRCYIERNGVKYYSVG